jgi:hypothetical protein
MKIIGYIFQKRVYFKLIFKNGIQNDKQNAQMLHTKQFIEES